MENELASADDVFAWYLDMKEYLEDITGQLREDAVRCPGLQHTADHTEAALRSLIEFYRVFRDEWMGILDGMLSKQQFMSVRSVGRLLSGDWDVPMNQVIAHPASDNRGRLTVRGKEKYASGGSRDYDMTAMTEDIRQHGVREPISVDKYRPNAEILVDEGHHRYVGARDAGEKRIPVEFTGGATVKDAKTYGVYTKPGGGHVVRPG